MSDEALLNQCRREAMRGTGPGGQKRNKTSSAIRLIHEPTGLSVRAEESRSQPRNLALALGRLRRLLALTFRSPPIDIPLNDLNPRRAPDIARVLDILAPHAYALSAAAPTLHTTTAALSTFLCAEDDLLSHINQERAKRSLKPLRRR